MSPIHYLTVQDMLWINHRVTGKVTPFRYDLLEEATFYQYGYGASTNLDGQAQRFLSGFAKKAPFPDGNEPTALVAAVAFLQANGKDIEPDKERLRNWLENGGDTPELKIVPGVEIHGQPDVRAIIEGVIMRLSGALQVPEAASAKA